MAVLAATTMPIPLTVVSTERKPAKGMYIILAQMVKAEMSSAMPATAHSIWWVRFISEARRLRSERGVEM